MYHKSLPQLVVHISSAWALKPPKTSKRKQMLITKCHDFCIVDCDTQGVLKGLLRDPERCLKRFRRGFVWEGKGLPVGDMSCHSYLGRPSGRLRGSAVGLRAVICMLGGALVDLELQLMKICAVIGLGRPSNLGSSCWGYVLSFACGAALRPTWGTSCREKISNPNLKGREKTTSVYLYR